MDWRQRKICSIGTAPLSDDESVAVSLFVEEDYVEAVRQYLDDNGASVRTVEEDTSRRMCQSRCLGMYRSRREL